jgi:ATP-dependent Lhr-like helicase
LWRQRKRASDLLSVASRYPSFPILLEAYRECVRDVFDIPAFLEVLRSIENQQVQVHVADSRTPSPFASSLLFSYVINYIYDGDAPLAERRAQALSIDQDQLQELLGDADLRELLDSDAIAEVEEQVQALGETQRIRHADGIHDLLLRLGDLSRAEILRRLANPNLAGSLNHLRKVGRLLEIKIAREERFIAVEDAARYRDALNISLPAGLPASLLEPSAQPVLELLRRYARTHGPFTVTEAASRFGLSRQQVEASLRSLALDGRVIEGGFRPNGLHREWCDAEVLRQIRRKSLARLRKEIEPVEQPMLARFTTHWQGVLQKRRGLDALLDTIESLQGAPLSASLVESSVLTARLAKYSSSDLDTLIAAGEVVWCGFDPLGERDGRIGLYLADKISALLPPRISRDQPALTEQEQQILDRLAQNGAMFFAQLHDSLGGGYPGEIIDSLWSLVWRGLVTNDTFHALRAYVARPSSSRQAKRQHNLPAFRSRRTTPPNAQGRWALLDQPERTAPAQQTAWSHALALQLLNRYGILTRETIAQENIPGGFSAIYDVLKALEESGRIRRGYFVAGLGATQFALPAAVDMLRSLRTSALPEIPEVVSLAATDPANLYGAALRWPQTLEDSSEPGSRSLTRSVGASVILYNGDIVAYLRRNNPNAQVFLPDDEPDRSTVARALADFLVDTARTAMRDDQTRSHAGLLIATINGQQAHQHWFTKVLLAAGFSAAPKGLNVRRPKQTEVDEPEISK